MRRKGDSTVTRLYGVQMPRDLLINISEAGGYKVMSLKLFRKILGVQGNCIHAHQPLREAEKTVTKIGERH